MAVHPLGALGLAGVREFVGRAFARRHGVAHGHDEQITHAHVAGLGQEDLARGVFHFEAHGVDALRGEVEIANAALGRLRAAVDLPGVAVDRVFAGHVQIVVGLVDAALTLMVKVLGLT